MSKIRELATPAEFDTLLQEMERPFFLLKHSTTCPISARAHDNVELFIKQNPEVPVYRVLVIESRPLSNHIAEVFSITHQSPQVFLISNRQCLWHASHLAITETSMEEQLAEIEK